MLQLLGFIIDCPDPMKLAAFYSPVAGRAIREGSSGDFACITFGEVDPAFQRVEDYRPPRLPLTALHVGAVEWVGSLHPCRSP